ALAEGVADLSRALRNAAGPIAALESAATSEPLAPRLLGQILRIEEGLVRQADRIRELELRLAERNAKVACLEQYTTEMRRHLDLQHEQLIERCRRVEDLEARLRARRHRYADRVANAFQRARRPFAK